METYLNFEDIKIALQGISQQAFLLESCAMQFDVNGVRFIVRETALHDFILTRKGMTIIFDELEICREFGLHVRVNKRVPSGQGHQVSERVGMLDLTGDL